MPTVSTMPAIPGRVSVAPSSERIATIIATLAASAILAITPSEAVGHHHEGDDENAADDAGDFAGVDRILAEAGADSTLFDDGQRRGQRAGPQQHGQVVGALSGEMAGNLAAAAEDRFIDARRRNHLIVEDDREQPADILLRRLAEALCTLAVETEGNDRLAGALVKSRLRIIRFSPATMTRSSMR